jgi:hypothetical protein
MAVIDRRDGVAGDIVTTDRRGGIADNVAIKRACLVAAADQYHAGWLAEH